MACTSKSVQKATEKSIASAQQIEKLREEIEKKDTIYKQIFFQEINEHLSLANVQDAREISFDKGIKIEFSNEFTLDKITKAVVAILKAVIQSQASGLSRPAMTPEAIKAYIDVVNTVAEAAKSSSTTSTSLSFSMNRLAPGMIIFLKAFSINMQNKDVFGAQAITITAIYYRFMQSIDDVRSEAQYGAALIDAKNLLNMKTLQAALTDSLAEGKITIDEWMILDEKYTQAIEVIQHRINTYQLDLINEPSMCYEPDSRSILNQDIVNRALLKLSRMGEKYTKIIEKSKERLAEAYY